MRLETLEALIHVEALGSIRAAADRVNLSQPALTAAIQQLEQELGAPLLHRSRRGATLTGFGRAFMPHAHLILSERQRAIDQIAQLRGRSEGSVRLSMSPAVALSVLPQALCGFRKRYPSIRVHCQDGTYPGVAPMLRSGTLDFALTPLHPTRLEKDLHCEPLYTTEIVIAAHRSHPLAGATQLAQLQDADWVLSTAAQGPGAVIQEVFKLAGLRPPTVVLVCESLLALPGVVAQLGLLATMPLALFRRHAELLGLVRIDVDGGGPPVLTIYALRRHDLPLTPAAQDLISRVRAVALERSSQRSAAAGDA